MRNRTVIRLLYALAVVAALVPPIVLIAYAHRLSAAQVGKELDQASRETVARAEFVIDDALASLRSAPVSAADGADPGRDLRAEVFRNPFLQAIVVRRAGVVVAASDALFTSLENFDDRCVIAPPAVGDFRIHPPVSSGLPAPALVICYRAGEDTFVQGFLNPAVFSKFADRAGRKARNHVYIIYEDRTPLVDFGNAGLPLPAEIADADGVQDTDDGLAVVSKSSRYPVRAVALAGFSAIGENWGYIGPRYTIAGILVAIVLVWLVIRSARRLSTLEADLREAIKFGEISVFYQPLVDLETNRCLGAEALMRWRHPRRGMLRAGEFIDVAERSRLILPMTDQVIETVAQDFGELLKDHPDLHVAVNLAPQHFTNTRILDTVRNTLAGRIPAGRVIFEITERSLVAGSDSVARTVMDGLVESGAKLAVDDFGTGYSNLNYLQRFPLDYLKIDKAFVDEIHSEDRSAGLVDQIIRIGRMLNMEIIAEGIEHARQVAYLRKEGVRMAQGWFFGEPMPIEEFRRFIAIHNAAKASEIR